MVIRVKERIKELNPCSQIRKTSTEELQAGMEEAHSKQGIPLIGIKLSINTF